jgi:hypothetical protein
MGTAMKQGVYADPPARDTLDKNDQGSKDCPI